MQINGINTTYSPAKTNFCARIPLNIENKVLTEAVEYGTEGLKKARAQIAKVQSWGHPESNIEMAFNPKNEKLNLGLSNFSMSKYYGAPLSNGEKDVYDTFMSLNKSDILNAEKQILEEVENSKLDLVIKACDNPQLMKKITGSVNPSDEDLAAAIDKLSEDEIINLRFNLDKPSKFSQGPILDIDV